MGLFDVFKKKKHSENAEPVSHISVFDDDLDHLDSDGELPFGWLTVNKRFTDQIQSECFYFIKAYANSRDKDPKAKYAALKSLVLYMHDAKKLCMSKGECFVYWLETCFTDDYLAEREQELAYIEGNFEKLESEYNRKLQIENEILPALRNKLLEIIKTTPGIIQTDVYKMFDGDIKQHVTSELYCMEKDGLIVRKKQGRTYSIHIK